MRPSPCGPPSSQCKPGSCPWPTTNRAQLSSDFTTERHRIGIFFQVSIVFRQILNFPPWVKGLTFVFQALFLQAFLLQPESSDLFACLFIRANRVLAHHYTSNKDLITELLLELYSSLKIYPQQVWISFWGANMSLVIWSNLSNWEWRLILTFGV